MTSGAVAGEASGGAKRSVTEPSGVQIPPHPPRVLWGSVVFYSRVSYALELEGRL
jgi:hypothetical protein